MGLIQKYSLVCNKCGTAVEGAEANVSVLNDDFFLCDDCLTNLVNWITKTIPTATEIKQSHEAETEAVVEKSTTPRVREKGERSPVYHRWDEQSIVLLLHLRFDQKMTYKECAKQLGVTRQSIQNILHGIRHAEVGTDKYPFRRALLEYEALT